MDGHIVPVLKEGTFKAGRFLSGIAPRSNLFRLLPLEGRTMRLAIVFAVTSIFLSTTVFAQEDPVVGPLPDVQPSRETGIPPSPQRGFYANSLEAAQSVQDARSQTKRALQGRDLNVAPKSLITEQCLIECKRLGYDDSTCNKGC